MWICSLEKRIKDNQTYQNYHWQNHYCMDNVQFYNREDKLLGKLEWKVGYKEGKPDNIKIISHDGRVVDMRYSEKIRHVSRPNFPDVSYTWDCQYITGRSLPDNRYCQIQYYEKMKQNVGGLEVRIKHHDDRRIGRVASLSAPVGTDASPITTHSFYYSLSKKRGNPKPVKGTCEVRDAYNNKTLYHFTDENRINLIEEFLDEDTVYRTQYFAWGRKGFDAYTCLTLSSKCGRNGILSTRQEFKYDGKSNPIVHTLIGNLSGRYQPMPASAGIYHNGRKKNSDAYTIHYKYNDKNLVIEKDDGKTIERKTYLDAASLVESAAISDSTGIQERKFYSYDSNGAVVEEIHDDGKTEERDDLLGVSQRLITRTKRTEIHPIGLPETIEEYSLNLQTGEEILLKKTHCQYSSEGHLLKKEVYDSQNTFAWSQEWKYDAMGNPVFEKDPLGRISTFAYDANGNCIKKTTPSQTTSYQYDYSNRLIKQTDSFPSTLSETFTYDYKGNRTSSTDIYGNTIHYAYDPFNRMVKKTLPPNQNGICPVEEYAYDIEDRPIAVTDANGNTTKKSYTPWNKPCLIEYPDGATEQFYYETDGTLLESIDQNGTRTIYTHDYKGRKLSEEVYSPTDELLSTKYWIYNAFHLLQEIDPEGIITRYRYDTAGRLISETRAGRETLYSYDTLGRQNETWEKIADGRYRVTIKKYDPLDQVIEERVEDQNGTLYSRTSYLYDFEGREISRTRHTEERDDTITKEYDGLGQLIRQTDANGFETHYTYTYGQNPATTRVDALGRQTVSIYDPNENLIEEQKLDPLGSPLHKTNFSYDLNGNQIERKDHIYHNADHLRTICTQFEYDSLNRQTAIIEPEQKITRTKYTPAGQVQSIQKPDGTTLEHLYDPLDRLETLISSDGTVHYAYIYDLNDNVLKTKDLANPFVLERTFDENSNLITERFNKEHASRLVCRRSESIRLCAQ